MKTYPYKEGVKHGIKTFGEWISKSNIDAIHGEEDVKKTAEEIITYPDQTKAWSTKEIGDYFDGFVEGCLIVWQQKICKNDDPEITLDDLP